MTDVKYNIDDTFTVHNKLTGNTYINDVTAKKIYIKAPISGKRKVVAKFYISDLVWNDSSKDIDKITLGGSASTEYTLNTNAAALKNRIIAEAYPSGGFVPGSSPDKKYQQFGVNEYLYEFIQLVVKAILDESLPVGTETVTLSISSSDTASFTNGTVTITAKDESNTAIQGLTIKGKIGTTNVNGTTDSSGQVSTTLTEAGTYAISVESTATTAYKAASKTGSVTVTAIEQQGDG